MVTDDLNLDSGHTVQYEDQVSQKYTFEIYIILTSVTPINLIKNLNELF